MSRYNDILWSNFVHPISRRIRQKRATTLLDLLPNFSTSNVCDVGGSRHYWEKVGGILKPRDLTLLNISDNGQAASQYGNKDCHVELYDGQHIPYPDKQFDIVLCNSVIEHVPPSGRAQLADEIRRVSRSYAIQTPALSFPIEPHFVMPFVHWLPRPIAKVAVRFSLYRLLTGSNRQALDAYFDEVQLLPLKEFRSYFPEAELVVEKWFGLTKSYTLIYRP